MPALRILGVRTPVAGDDLQIVCLVTLILRLIQLASASYLLSVFARATERSGGDADPFPECNAPGGGTSYDLFRYFVPMTFASAALTVTVCLAAVPLELYIWSVGRRGSPVETEKREKLRPLCNVRFGALGFLQLCAFGVGVAALSQASFYCQCISEQSGFDSPGFLECRLDTAWYTCFLIIVWSQLIEGCVWAFIIVRASWIGFRAGTNRVLERDAGVTQERRWQFCCRLCCTCSSFVTCCLFGGREADTGGYLDISRTLANYFDDGGNLDITVSDIVVGLIVVMREQKKRTEAVKEGLLREAARAKSPLCDNADGSCHSEVVTESSSKLVLEVNQGDMQKATNCLRKEGVGDSILEGNSPSEQESQSNACTPSQAKDAPEEAVPLIVSSKSSLSIDDSNTRRHMSLIAEAEERGEGGIDGCRRGQSLANRIRRENSRPVVEAGIRTLLVPGRPEDLRAVAEGARYCRWALAIYSWKMYQVHHPCTGVCTLGFMRCLNLARCKGGCGASGNSSANRNQSSQTRSPSNPERRTEKDDDQVVVGDTPLLCLDRTALTHISDLSDAQIPYAQFRGGFATTPYFIGIDPTWKTVAIVLRGTLSFDDVVTDVTLDPVSLEAWGNRCGFDGKGEYGHGGVVACAGWVYEDLERHGILDRLLLGDSPQCPGYRLRIAGHSLGAGTAAVLAVMLRSSHPTLRCISYEPPGCVFSGGLAESCGEFVTSFVLNDDIIPRLSLKSMEHLRDDVLDKIAKMKVPKRVVMGVHIFGGKKGNSAPTSSQAGEYGDEPRSSLLHRQASAPHSKFLEELEEFRALQVTRRLESGVPDIEMRPPGRIIHMVKTRRAEASLLHCAGFRKGNLEHPYDARWAESDDFGEILVSNGMVSDHDPLNVCRAVEGIASALGLEEPYLPLST
uniref:sn-1-specific diacylglycerol lipase n=1 Tax=Odontella aurita TaxID=265563 RepID=A0A7S4I7Q3_9STRA|mmetsp:Transcript_20900/g.60861  ORF Transcript_20900/g.60861 Transcript_20900/m.60861 type:complete len:909 (+) Transcript_20900:157-2883(+)